MFINHKFTMDLVHRDPVPKIDVMQDDQYTRNLEIRLLEHQNPFILPEDFRILVRYEKPDHTKGAYDTLPDGSDAWSHEENLLTVAVAPQVCTAAGIVTLTVTLIAGSAELSSFPVQIFVHPIPGKNLVSRDYFSITHFIPQPDRVRPGQYLAVSAVDSSGRILALSGVDSTASIYEEACRHGYSGTEEAFYQTLAKTADRNRFAAKKICTIIDDDTTSTAAVQRFCEALRAKGITGSIAVLTNFFTKENTLKNILVTMERAGFQMVLHGYEDLDAYADPGTEGNLALCEDDLVHGIQDLQKANFANFRFWVYPKGACGEQIQALARKWGMEAGIALGDQANTMNTADGKYHLKRFALEERDSTGPNDPDGYTTTLAGLKASILAASAQNDWVIIRTHFANWTDGEYSRIHELIDYAQGLGYEFMTLGEAWTYRKGLYEGTE